VRAPLAIYFMYDVKQFVPAEWSSPPLEGRLVHKDGLGMVCMGRGAVNQKGPENSFLSALLAFRAAGTKLPVNLVLVCEGEEEIGSPHFHEVVQTPKVLAELKKCSGVFMPEAGQELDGGVQVNLGAKGVIELELVSTGEEWGRGPARTCTPASRPRSIPHLAPRAGVEHAGGKRRAHPAVEGPLREAGPSRPPRSR
jgi:acetylornithine deacetylase/succinyl-diaminopimelate desuccinylase-like protein